MPDRVPGDAVTSTGTFHAAMRASLAMVRGEDDAARAALDELRRAVLANRHPQWVEVLESMTIQLAVREGRLEDAREAAARGLPLIEGTEEGGRLVKLLWAALMVEAEAAERSRQAVDDEHVATLRARLAGAVTRPGQWAEGPRYAALAEAELTRIERAPDPETWLAAAAGFDEIALPWPAAYARLRAAEAFVAAGDRAGAAAPLAAVLAAAERMEAAPLAEAAGALARRARVRIEAPRARAGAARPARPDAARARGAAARRGGPHQPRDRRAAVHEREDRERARLADPGQARRRAAGSRRRRSRTASG